MTSATLYREGPDLDVLLAELDAEHNGNVRVVDVDYGRDGGVMGFFARRTVGVHFVVTDSADPAPAEATSFEDAGTPLEAMLRAAEAAEMIESGRAPVAAEDTGDNVEFARMLLDMATRKAAARAGVEGPDHSGPDRSQPVSASAQPNRSGQDPLALLAETARPIHALDPDLTDPALPWSPSVVVDSFAVGFDTPVVDVPAPVAAADFAASRAELLERVRVRPVGAHRVADEDESVPAPVVHAAPAPAPVVQPAPVVHPAPVVPAPVVQAAPIEPEAAVVLPANPTRSPLTLRRQLAEVGVPLSWIPDDSASAYAVIEQLVRQVPLAAPTDLGPGQVLVVAGPAAQAQAEAVRMAGRLRLDPASIRTAGCGADPIRHRRQAAALELEVRGTRTEPCIVVVATDSSADLGGAADLAWAAEIVAALAPDHLLLVVDATTRVTDARTTLAAFGAVSAIAIVSAARTASPAAMWELGVPVASLDGREATRGGWAALLIDRLTTLDGA